jgi:predicted GNAT family acetyltransferase
MMAWVRNWTLFGNLNPGPPFTNDLPCLSLRALTIPSVSKRFWTAVRWGAISQSDDRALHSPFRSGIEIDDYQLDPVVRAMSMPRVNLLIADDVGLGKTIEAGLVAQELILRHRVRSVLIVCPSSLQLQWRDEMRDKFGLEFRIVDSEGISQLRRKRGIHVNPWSHFPRLITSIDFLKRERPLRSFSQLSILEYTFKNHRLFLTHTEVPPALESQGLGTKLAHAALEYARQNIIFNRGKLKQGRGDFTGGRWIHH